MFKSSDASNAKLTCIYRDNTKDAEGKELENAKWSKCKSKSILSDT